MGKTYERLCKHYCNAMRAGGHAGPLCPHCEACEIAFRFWERLFR